MAPLFILFFKLSSTFAESDPRLLAGGEACRPLTPGRGRSPAAELINTLKFSCGSRRSPIECEDLFAAANASAATTAMTCVGTRLNAAATNPFVDDVKIMREAVAWSERHLFAEMQVPESAGVLINPQAWKFAEYDPVKFRFVRRTREALQLTPHQVAVIDVHENVHNVFEYGLSRWSAEVSEYQIKARFIHVRDTPKLNQLGEQLDEISNRLSVEPDRTKSIALETKRDELISSRIKVIESLPELGSVPKVLTTSHEIQEIAADLGGVARAGSRDAYATILKQLASDPAEHEFIDGRAFLKKVSVAGWSETLKRTNDPKHAHYNPARSFIAETYLKRRVDMNKFMPKLIESLSREAIVDSRRTNEDLIDAESKNRLLIERLRQDLKAFEK